MRILKPAPTAAIVTFFKFVSGIRDRDSSNLELKEIQPGFVLTFTEGDGFQMKTQSNYEAVQSLDTDRMESVGGCVLNLIQLDFKLGSIPGLLFVQCLGHLASQLCRTTGYVHPTLIAPTSATQVPNITTTNTTVTSETVYPTQSTRSSVLLECEERQHGLAHTQAYHNTLVLYVTAALCEHMSDEVLQRVSDLPLLLETISAIVHCHACYVSSERAAAVTGVNGGGGRGASLLVVAAAKPSLDELPGGPITLSIVFGLLSAILGGGKEVSLLDEIFILRPLVA